MKKLEKSAADLKLPSSKIFPIPKKSSSDISETLQQLHERGADIREFDKSGAVISKKVIDRIKKDRLQEFEAWVAWSRSF